MVENKFLVSGGAIIASTPIRDMFAGLKEGNYSITIKRDTPKRSNNQNRYYWACLGYIAVEVGYIHEDMDQDDKSKITQALHVHFKDRFLKGKTFKSTKDRRKKIHEEVSTKDLNTEEFAEYMNKIKLLHPYIPDANGSDELLQWIDAYNF